MEKASSSAHSGNMRPASMRMYRSRTPTSMQFMPISPRPPMGRTLSGGPSSGGGPGNLCLLLVAIAVPKCSVPSLFLYVLGPLRSPPDWPPPRPAATANSLLNVSSSSLNFVSSKWFAAVQDVLTCLRAVCLSVQASSFADVKLYGQLS